MNVRQHIAPALLAVVLSGLAVWGRVPPLVVVSTEAAPDKVQRGERFVIRRTLRWIRGDCDELQLSAVLIDSLDYTHVLDKRNLGIPHMTEHVSREWQIPYTMPWGEAHYRAHFTAECFPLYGWWPIEMPQTDTAIEIVP